MNFCWEPLHDLTVEYGAFNNTQSTHSVVWNSQLGRYSVINLADRPANQPITLDCDVSDCVIVCVDSAIPVFVLQRLATAIAAYHPANGRVMSKFAVEAQHGRITAVQRIGSWILAFTKAGSTASYILCVYIDPHSSQLELKHVEPSEDRVFSPGSVAAVQIDRYRTLLVLECLLSRSIGSQFYIFDTSSNLPTFQKVASHASVLRHPLILDAPNGTLCRLYAWYRDFTTVADLIHVDIRTGLEVDNLQSRELVVDVDSILTTNFMSTNKIVVLSTPSANSGAIREIRCISPTKTLEKNVKKFEVTRPRQQNSISTNDDESTISMKPNVLCIPSQDVWGGEYFMLGACFGRPAGTLSVQLMSLGMDAIKVVYFRFLPLS
jgi:hypothetical protein